MYKTFVTKQGGFTYNNHKQFKNNIVMRDFVEIHDDFIDNGKIYIDAFTTADPDEEGMVVAKIEIDTGNVEYLCEEAKVNKMIQEVISENLKNLGFL